MFAGIQGKGTGQTGGVHDDDGGGAVDLPALRQGQTDPEDAAGQVRRAGRFHEQGHSTGNQTEDEKQPRRRAASFSRRTPPWGEKFYLLIYYN